MKRLMVIMAMIITIGCGNETIYQDQNSQTEVSLGLVDALTVSPHTTERVLWNYEYNDPADLHNQGKIFVPAGTERMDIFIRLTTTPTTISIPYMIIITKNGFTIPNNGAFYSTLPNFVTVFQTVILSQLTEGDLIEVHIHNLSDTETLNIQPVSVFFNCIFTAHTQKQSTRD